VGAAGGPEARARGRPAVSWSPLESLGCLGLFATTWGAMFQADPVLPETPGSPVGLPTS